MVIESKEAHRALFDKLVEGYKAKNVTEIIRVCEVAEFRSPTVIRAMHISHIMSGNHRVEDPMPTLSTTEFINGKWHITAAQYAATKNVPIGRALDLRVAVES